MSAGWRPRQLTHACGQVEGTHVALAHGDLHHISRRRVCLLQQHGGAGAARRARVSRSPARRSQACQGPVVEPRAAPPAGCLKPCPVPSDLSTRGSVAQEHDKATSCGARGRGPIYYTAHLWQPRRLRPKHEPGGGASGVQALCRVVPPCKLAVPCTRAVLGRAGLRVSAPCRAQRTARAARGAWACASSRAVARACTPGCTTYAQGSNAGGVGGLRQRHPSVDGREPAIMHGMLPSKAPGRRRRRTAQRGTARLTYELLRPWLPLPELQEGLPAGVHVHAYGWPIVQPRALEPASGRAGGGWGGGYGCLCMCASGRVPRAGDKQLQRADRHSQAGLARRCVLGAASPRRLRRRRSINCMAALLGAGRAYPAGSPGRDPPLTLWSRA